MAVTAGAAMAQTDSLYTLGEVTVRAFEQNRKARTSTSAVKFILRQNADLSNRTSLVTGFNSIAGVRMEERSPGSYRMNIRGSSLRSPFGVRNVKVYWNDIPFTDAGGNTYFNQLAWNNFSTIEVVKGPVSSLYGAGTGGLLLINSFDRWEQGVSLDYMTGSYNLHNVFASARFGKKENRNIISYAHNQSGGYREQSALRRDNFSWVSRISASEKQELTASLLFTDLYYETPGGLTLSEYGANPKAARPAAGIFPSAVAAKAAIYQKNLLAGFSSRYRFDARWTHTVTLYGAFAHIRNPSIRNYERRLEPQFGGRSILSWRKPLRGSNGSGTHHLQVLGGAEYQYGIFNTRVSDNREGRPDTLRSDDDVRNTTYHIFVQADLALQDKWFWTAGVSINRSGVAITRQHEYPVITRSRSYRNELAPRLAVRRNFAGGLALLASLSRGFSPPTTAEVLPSTGVISTNLEAERGWNYEITGMRTFFRNKLHLEVTGFYFPLKQALVQRRDLSGADFFVNAGEIKQKGVEASADYTLIGPVAGGFDYLLFTSSYTFSQFRYDDFVKDNNDYSGKKVPSVPAHTFSLLADLHLKNGIYSQATIYIASRIYLNDANTAVAAAYQLLGWRLGWKKDVSHRHKLHLFAGADNLLGQTYSLGNDINAFGGRFYNAAPGRNFYLGAGWAL